ncbi:MAG TPA: response regulator [Actinomycetota bacterium]|nr:response regulator [Actinomycetota bacterium]
MSQANQPIRVLLVDDSLPFRELMGILLVRDPGFLVVAEASDGIEAIEMVEKHHPDVVLLDIAMPRMDGLQALPAIKAAHPLTKVVVLSAFSESEMLEKASGRGADAYLEKGKVLKEIRETIARVHAA